MTGTEHVFWSCAELNRYIRYSLRQALASTDVHRHTGPSPVVHKELHGSVCVGLRLRVHPFFLPESGQVLSADAGVSVLARNAVLQHFIRLVDADRSQQLGALVAHGAGGKASIRLHHYGGHYLQEMVLHHIPQSARLLIVSASPLHANAFRCGDLNVVNITTVPKRLKDAVGKTKGENVLDGFLPKVMVDAIRVGFIEGCCQMLFQGIGGFHVVSDWFLHHHTPVRLPFVDPALPQHIHSQGIEARLRAEVENHFMRRIATERFNLLANLLVEFRVLHVAGDVEQALRKAMPLIIFKRSVL